MELVKLKTKLKLEMLGGRSQAEVGRTLRTINEKRLGEILNDSWTSLKREQIEELCGRFGLGIEDLFEIEKSQFWDPVKETSEYFIVSELEQAGREIPRDRAAMSLVEQFVHRQTEVVARRDCPQTVEEADKLLSSNCVVVGLRNNLAAEVAICRLFGAEPFDPREANRKKLRIAFSRGKVPGYEESALIVPCEEEPDGRLMGGVQRNGEWVMKDQVFEPSEFLAKEIPAGMDGGIIVAAKRQSGTRELITVVVAGLSRIGTYAGADLLAESPENIYPQKENEFAVTFFKAVYGKKTGSLNRDYRQKIVVAAEHFPLPTEIAVGVASGP